MPGPDDASAPRLDPVGRRSTTARRRVEALARVRALLLELGCTDEEIDRAVDDDVVDLLVVDRMLVPTGHRMTQAEVAERTDIPIEMARRFWRALGFLDVGDDDAVFTDMDIEAVQLFQTMVAMGLVDPETAVQMARVIGSSMARIAEAEAAPGTTPILMATGDSVLDADAVRPPGRSLHPGHGPAARVRVAPPPAGGHPAGHAAPGPRSPTRASAR